MSEPSAPPRAKSVDDYEYTLKIHEVDPDAGTVTVLFEEVDGNDGFAVALQVDEFRKLAANRLRLEKWAHEQVQRRIELLKQVKAVEERKAKAREEVKELEEKLKEIKLKPRK